MRRYGDPLTEIEGAIRRVYERLKIQPHETGLETALKMIADEIAKTRRALSEPE